MSSVRSFLLGAVFGAPLLLAASEIGPSDLFVFSNGSVFVEDVLGSHVLEGDFVDTRRLEGEAQIRAGSLGVNAEIWPYEDGDVFIDSAGSVTLALPAFGPYDIRIVGQVSESLTLVDLGFDEVVLGEGFAEAWRHPRTTRIEVFTSGTFELAESR
jgi:hypothetical protein